MTSLPVYDCCMTLRPDEVSPSNKAICTECWGASRHVFWMGHLPLHLWWHLLSKPRSPLCVASAPQLKQHAVEGSLPSAHWNALSWHLICKDGNWQPTPSATISTLPKLNGMLSAQMGTAPWTSGITFVSKSSYCACESRFCHPGLMFCFFWNLVVLSVLLYTKSHKKSVEPK